MNLLLLLITLMPSLFAWLLLETLTTAAGKEGSESMAEQKQRLPVTLCTLHGVPHGFQNVIADKMAVD